MITKANLALKQRSTAKWRMPVFMRVSARLHIIGGARKIPTAKWYLERKRNKEFSTTINQDIEAKVSNVDVTAPEIVKAIDSLMDKL